MSRFGCRSTSNTPNQLQAASVSQQESAGGISVPIEPDLTSMSASAGMTAPVFDIDQDLLNTFADQAKAEELARKKEEEEAAALKKEVGAMLLATAEKELRAALAEEEQLRGLEQSASEELLPGIQSQRARIQTRIGALKDRVIALGGSLNR